MPMEQKKHRTVEECWVRQEALQPVIGLLGKYVPINIIRPNNYEVGRLVPRWIEVRGGRRILVASYHQADQRYSPEAQDAKPPQRWVDIDNPIKWKAWCEAKKKEKGIPHKIEITGSPTAPWPNKDFPRVTPVSKVDIEVQLDMDNEGPGISWVQAEGASNR